MNNSLSLKPSPSNRKGCFEVLAPNGGRLQKSYLGISVSAYFSWERAEWIRSEILGDGKRANSYYSAD